MCMCYECCHFSMCRGSHGASFLVVILTIPQLTFSPCSSMNIDSKVPSPFSSSSDYHSTPGPE